MRNTPSACSSLAAITAVLISAASASAAEEGADRMSPEAAVRASAEAFAEAFNRGDAAGVAALWTSDGSLIDAAGAVFQGRTAIEAQYAALFKKHPGARIEIAVARVEFPTKTMAIEDGFTRVASDASGTAGIGRYTAVHVLEDGRWLMAAVRESSLPPPSGDAHMNDLQWLIGVWQSKSEEGIARWTFRWIADRRFIQCDYSVEKDGRLASSGTQIIGWDPHSRQVRSWSFESAGGHRTGVWTATPDGWRIDGDGVLADGAPTSSRELLRRSPGNKEALGWRSVSRTPGSSDLSDTSEVILDRLPAENEDSQHTAD
jgi:uncharacterized protein (TIGR02246 family)